MKRRHKTLAFILVGLAAVGGAAALVLNVLDQNLMYFFSPTEVAAKAAPEDRAFRLGGLVKTGSVKRDNTSTLVHFEVTDNAETVPVVFSGILPDLFREGQGVVAQGKMGPGGVFHADEVLAKHDETYMPPEVAQALEKAKQANTTEVSETVATQ